MNFLENWFAKKMASKGTKHQKIKHVVDVMNVIELVKSPAKNLFEISQVISPFSQKSWMSRLPILEDEFLLSQRLGDDFSRLCCFIYPPGN